MNRSIIIIGAVFFCLNLAAQRPVDSLQQKAVQGIKERFPRERVLNFEYGQSHSRDFESKLLGENF